MKFALSDGGSSTGFLLVMAIIGILVLGCGLWMTFKPEQAWRFKHAGQFRKPEEVEPSDFGLGSTRFIGLALVFFVGIVSFTAVQSGFGEIEMAVPGPAETSLEGDSPRVLCRNWDKREYDKVTKAAGKASDVIVPAAYQANRCTLAEGNGLEEFREVMRRYSDSGDRAEERVLQEFFATYLTNDGLVSAWSTLCLQTDESTGAELGKTQQILGKGLAVASSVGRVHVNESWDELRELGHEQIQLRTYVQPAGVEAGEHTERFDVAKEGPVVYGWSVLAPLLRYGDFDAGFLALTATEILRFDERHQDGWTVPGEEWVSFDPKASDPMVDDAIEAVMEALSRNEDAAKKVAKETGDARVEELLEG